MHFRDFRYFYIIIFLGYFFVLSHTTSPCPTCIWHPDVPVSHETCSPPCATWLPGSLTLYFSSHHCVLSFCSFWLKCHVMFLNSCLLLPSVHHDWVQYTYFVTVCAVHGLGSQSPSGSLAACPLHTYFPWPTLDQCPLSQYFCSLLVPCILVLFIRQKSTLPLF